MPFLTIKEMNAIQGLERRHLENLGAMLNDAIRTSVAQSVADGVDYQLLKRAVVPYLLTTASRMTLGMCSTEENEYVEHYFMSCAAEAMMSSVKEEAMSRPFLEN